MFKNLMIYRIAPEWEADLGSVEAALDKNRFVPCGPTQQKSSGWVEPRGEAHAALVESVRGQWLMKLATEQRVVPTAVVKKRAEEIATHIEQTSGRKPGKREMKELKEQALMELLPMAFTRQSMTRVWINPEARFLLVDAGSASKADEVTTLLVKTLAGLSLRLVQTALSPAAAMTAWLMEGTAPEGFAIDRECELKSTDEMKSVVRYARHLLDIDEVKQHLQHGKVPTRLAMSWQDRIAFTLTDTLALKKLAFLEAVMEQAADDGVEKGFDGDALIATSEIGHMLPELLEALGGESDGLQAALQPAAAPV